jgi:hypothetical protein
MPCLRLGRFGFLEHHQVGAQACTRPDRDHDVRIA